MTLDPGRKQNISEKIPDSLSGLKIAYNECQKRIERGEAKKDIWMSQIKGLPTVLIANSIAITVASYLLGSQNSDQIQYIFLTAIGTFILFAGLLVGAVVFAWDLSNKLPDLRGKAEEFRSKIEEKEDVAKEMFRKYKEGFFPSIAERVNSDSLSKDGHIHYHLKTREWRDETKITLERQKDMEFIDKDLTIKMDQLIPLTNTFIESFEKYSISFLNAISKLQLMPVIASNTNSIVIAASAFYTKTIQNATQIDDAMKEGLIDSPGKTFLEAFFSGNPNDSGSISVLQNRADIADLAKRAFEDWKQANAIRKEISLRIRYHYSAET